MDFQHCSGILDENSCFEDFYLFLDIIPILVVWILVIVVIIILVIFYLCLCCLNSERFENSCQCSRCHCPACGQLKCQDCKSCEKCSSSHHICHSIRGCYSCKPEYNSQSELTEPTNYGTTEVTVRKKRNSAKCTRTGIVKFVLNCGNSLVKLLFGGKLGLVREFPQRTTADRFGRERLFINEYSVVESAHLLHFMLAMKVLVFFGFCFATGVDLFFVDSDLSCDASRDCYIFDDNYSQLPITNCSYFVDNRNFTTVCYAIVLDFSGAASTMGGLLSATVLETVIIAYTSIFFYTKCFCSCCREHKRKIWPIIQCGCAVIVLIGFIALYAVLVDKNTASTLRRTGDWISFLGHPCSVAFSMLIPWHYAVDQDIDLCKRCQCLSSDETPPPSSDETPPPSSDETPPPNSDETPLPPDKELNSNEIWITEEQDSQSIETTIWSMRHLSDTPNTFLAVHASISRLVLYNLYVHIS